jgi:ATP-dependent Lon protease
MLHNWWAQAEWPHGIPFSLEEADFRNEQTQPPADGVIEAPLLPLRDMVIYPKTITPLFVGREPSIHAVEMAFEYGEPLVTVAQRDADVLHPEADDLFEMGAEVDISRMLHMPDGAISMIGQGIQRVKITEYVHLEPYIRVRAVPIHEEVEQTSLTEALRRAVLALFEKVVQLNRNLPEDAYVFAMNIEEPGHLADLMAQVLDLKIEQRQEILETLNTSERLQQVSVLLANELDVLELEDRIHSQVQQELDRTQREYFLREQMKVIQSELGESDIYTREVNGLRDKLDEIELPDEAREQAEKELERLAAMPPMSPETGMIITYLDWLIDLPWSETTEDNLDIKNAEEILESCHYGLPKAKERILEYVAVRKMAADKMRSPILCFVGPPGTGKTSMGKSVAQALGRKFVRVSLGGVRDVAEIRGHRRTYIGSLPGRIIQTMRRAGTINPLFMLDEIDKVGLDFRGDPAAALLEVLDPEQNHAFADHYLEVAYDLSKVLFITTANVLDPIPPALRDRMEVIEFPGYVDEEKLEIARRFLIPRQMEEHGLEEYSITFTTGALQSIVREYTYEAGVRNMEREIANICRKIDRQLAEGNDPPRRIMARSLARYLGPPKFIHQLAEEEDTIGVATGVAWTEAGGDLMPVEVLLMPGKGNLMLTGQLGDVLQESGQAALSYARSRCDDFDIDPDIFDKVDIHIHLPEGAIPKDGPSAGITIATALISALSEQAVRHDVGMTGEITLRGRVLPIGGLKEKLLTAHRAGLKTVIIPEQNKKDLVEIPRQVRRGIKIVMVENMEEVLSTALTVPAEVNEKDTN